MIGIDPQDVPGATVTRRGELNNRGLVLEQPPHEPQLRRPRAGPELVDQASPDIGATPAKPPTARMPVFTPLATPSDRASAR